MVEKNISQCFEPLSQPDQIELLMKDLAAEGYVQMAIALHQEFRVLIEQVEVAERALRQLKTIGVESSIIDEALTTISELQKNS